MKQLKIFFLLSFFALRAFSQLPYTQNQFQYDSIINVEYGTAVDYAGNTDTLLLDIYKPVGDSNCLRPVMIMIHGGAWIAGSKADANMVHMSRLLAKKGWVVANINYRLGTHKTSSYNMYALCNTSLSAPCGYICDSTEVYRANFRAMQDAKGAVRFMKSRHAIDSSDINNVFVAGESAGGFIALATALTDKSSEKHPSCFAIANAPTPSSNLNVYGCIPSPNNLSRPDLGSIDGTMHTGTYNAKVKGVGNFYGGILDLNIVSQTADTPVVYLFHQGSDVVVHYDYGKLLGRTSWECYAQTNICQQYYFYPFAHGSESIRKHFVSLGANAPNYQADIVNNYSYMNNCFSNGHSIDNINMRLQNMVNLFAPVIAASGNNPSINCQQTSVGETEKIKAAVYPNPANEYLNITSSKEADFIVYSAYGQIVSSGKAAAGNTRINVSYFLSGVYFVYFHNSNKAVFFIKD